MGYYSTDGEFENYLGTNLTMSNYTSFTACARFVGFENVLSNVRNYVIKGKGWARLIRLYEFTDDSKWAHQDLWVLSYGCVVRLWRRTAWLVLSYAFDSYIHLWHVVSTPIVLIRVRYLIIWRGTGVRWDCIRLNDSIYRCENISRNNIIISSRAICRSFLRSSCCTRDSDNWPIISGAYKLLIVTFRRGVSEYLWALEVEDLGGGNHSG